MDCTDLYLKINHNLQENIQASLSSSHYTLFANANAFIDDYGLWQKWIAEKYGIEIFSLALSEYETALLFAVQSLYKQAFSSLRAYLEHTLFGIQLTTNLLQYLNWKQDARMFTGVKLLIWILGYLVQIIPQLFFQNCARHRS